MPDQSRLARRKPATIHALAITALLALPLAIPGCLISSNKSTRIDGAYVHPGTVTQIRLHQTTAAETEEIMGAPSFKNTHDDGAETWTWNWTESKDSSGSLFLVFGGSSEKTVTESVHVQFKNGVVVKKWRD
ncbi:MAG: hypothetical protein WD114_00795 [Phycisphaerales bacterium]